MTILSIIENEFKDKAMVQVPFLIDRLAISSACHVMNLSNIDDKRFFHAGSLENFRMHVVLVAPSGFGKTIPFKFFLGKYGLLSKTDLKISVRGTFSKEAWLGTYYSEKSGNNKSEMKASKGIFNRYKRGIIGADEFMRLKNLCNGEGIEHDEIYLMTALDSDTATKDLSFGSIEENDIGTTLWVGMRISQLNTVSGFARRWMFQVFFPTPSIARLFRYAGRDEKIKQPISELTKTQLKEELDQIRDSVKDVRKIDFTELEKLLDTTMAIPHFEEVIYKRMALGYAIANGTFPDIVLDDRLVGLIINEHWGRHTMREHPEKEMMYQVILNEPTKMTQDELFEFVSRYYQLNSYQIRAAWHSLASDELVAVDRDGLLTALPKKISTAYSLNGITVPQPSQPVVQPNQDNEKDKQV